MRSLQDSENTNKINRLITKAELLAYNPHTYSTLAAYDQLFGTWMITLSVITDFQDEFEPPG